MSNSAIIDCNTCRHHVQDPKFGIRPSHCYGCLNSPSLSQWEAIPATSEALADPYTPVPAPKLLTKAAELMAERGRQYDRPEGERSMGRAVTAFNAITGRDLSESEGWLLLQVLKDVRQWQRKGYHQDSAEDCIAYAALKAEALQSEKP